MSDKVDRFTVFYDVADPRTGDNRKLKDTITGADMGYALDLESIFRCINVLADDVRKLREWGRIAEAIDSITSLTKPPP